MAMIVLIYAVALILFAIFSFFGILRLRKMATILDFTSESFINYYLLASGCIIAVTILLLILENFVLYD